MCVRGHLHGQKDSGHALPVMDDTATAPGPRPRRRFHTVCFRLARAVLVTTAIVTAVPVVIGAAVITRVAIAPLDITPLIRRALPLSLAEPMQNARPAARLTLDRLTVAWPVRSQGWDAPVVIRTQGVAVLDRQGRRADTIADGQVALGLRPLLHGKMSLSTIDLAGADMALARHPDGSVALDLPGMGSNGGQVPVDLGHLRRITLDSTRVSLADAISGMHIVVEPFHAALSVLHVDGRFGAVGDVTTDLVLGHQRGRFAAHGRVLPENGGVAWVFSLKDMRPTVASPLVPALRGVDVPLSLNAAVQFRPGINPQILMPTGGQLGIVAGAGSFTQADGSVLWLRGAQADMTLSLLGKGTDGDAFRAALSRLSVTFAPDLTQSPERDVHLDVSGMLEASDFRRPRRVRGHIDAAIPHLDLADTLHVWPLGVAHGARAWISNNIPHGDAQLLNAHVDLAGNAGWRSVRPSGLSGGLDAHGLEVHWLRPAPPMVGVDGRLVLDNPESLTITFEHGHQVVHRDGHHVGLSGDGQLQLDSGRMQIENLDHHFQDGDIRLAASGDLADLVALLDEKRLNLLSRHPFPFTRPSGHVKAQLGITLPLRTHVRLDQVTIDARAEITKAHLGNAVLGRSIDNGTISVAANTQGLTASGSLLLGGVPSDARYSMDFRKNPAVHVAEQGHLVARLTPQAANAAAIPAASLFSGMALVDADYKKRSDNTAEIALALNLHDADVKIPIWHKPVGQQADASVLIGLAAGKLAFVQGLRATGPNLDVTAHTDVQNGIVSAIDIDSFRLGRSSGSARVGLPPAPKDPFRVSVDARAVDLSPLLSAQSDEKKKVASYTLPMAASGTVPQTRGQSWSVDLTTPVLYYRLDRSVGSVRAHLFNDGKRLTALDFAMQAPTAVQAHLVPRKGRRDLSVIVDDSGKMLDSTGVMQHVDGGHGTLSGHFDDTQASAPFSGTLNVGPFVMRDAPEMLRLVNDLSVFGWFDGLPGSDFPVTRLSMPLTFDDGILRVHDAEMGNASIGATLQGAIDLNHKHVDVDGTLVPAFAVNALPGRLPGVGKLFSPERGGGMLSATYTLTGALDAPKLHVNPLAVLLPGIFRKMLQ